MSETNFTQKEIMDYSLELRNTLLNSAEKYFINLEKSSLLNSWDIIQIFSTAMSWDIIQIFSTAMSVACAEVHMRIIKEKEIVQ